jgi:probable HAF family extracellular repeat protein
MKTTKSPKLQRIILLGLAAAVPLWPAAAGAAPKDEYNFQALEVPAEWGTETSAYGINNAGVIVGSFFSVNFDNDGFLLKKGLFTPVSVPDTVFIHGSLFGVNDRGEAVGIFIDAETEFQSAFVLSRKGEIEVLPDITVLPDASPDSSGSPFGINNQGTIVGSYRDVDDNLHGFILSDGVYTSFDFPGLQDTSLNGINDPGQIVGYGLDVDGNAHGFVIRKGVATPIAVPGAVKTFPFGINNRGQIVGAYRGADNVNHGFLFEKGNYRTLDFPGAIDTVLRGINDRGVIVGTYDFSTVGLVATPGK